MDLSIVRSLAQQGRGIAYSGGIESWTSDFDEAHEIAKKQNKTVFIDFTGYTCTNRRTMEANLFLLAEIQKRFAKMQQVRLYTDGGPV